MYFYTVEGLSRTFEFVVSTGPDSIVICLPVLSFVSAGLSCS